MDFFLPSDVARLVLGFLKENGYSNTYSCFLKECPDLQEYLRLLKAGRELQTTILGYSLLLILQEWGKMKQGQTPALHVVAEKTKSKTKSSNLHRSASSTCKNRKSPHKQSRFMQPATQNNSDSNESDAGGAVNMTGVPETPIVWSTGSPAKTNLKEKFESNSLSNDKPSSSGQHLPSPSKLSVISSSQSVISKTLLCKSVTDSNGLVSDTGYPLLKSLLVPQQMAQETQSTSDTVTSADRGIADQTKPVEAKVLDNIGHVAEAGKEVTVFNEITKGVSQSSAGTELRQTIVSGCSVVSCQVTGQSSIHATVQTLESEDSNNKCVSWIKESVQGKCATSSDDINYSPSDAVILTSMVPQIAGEVTPKKAPRSRTVTEYIITPIKELQATEGMGQTRSPRRKKPKTPRKRTSDISPASIHSSTEDPVVPVSNEIFKKILNDTRLHEKLAQTCNSVTVQLKMNHSGKEGEKESKAQGSVDQEMEDLEAITASKSLEEILDMDTNFATDLVGEKIDMNDPAFDSLFRLFGTDKESFNEHQKREKTRTEQMESEVEELEKSIQEMASSYAASPHHDELFGSPQPDMSSVEASTQPHDDHLNNCTPPSGEFTSLLHQCEINNSPVHSTPSQPYKVPSGQGDQCLYSPCSTTTQPFSPCISDYQHVTSTMSPISTAPPQPLKSPPLNSSQHIDSPGRPQEVPGTPEQLNTTIDDTVSPVSHLSSTPLGSPVADGQQLSVHFSTPTHKRSTSCLPPNCSPLVKGDIHIGSPVMIQKNGPMVPKAKRMLNCQPGNRPPSSPKLLNRVQAALLHERSEHVMEGTNSDTPHSNHGQTDSGVCSQVSDTCSMASGNMSYENNPCSTIENSVGLICLPKPASHGNTDPSREDKGKAQKGKSSAKAKKARAKKDDGKKFTTLKGILAQPTPNVLPPDTIPPKPIPLNPATPEKNQLTDIHTEDIVLMSPGGSTFTVPMLGCHDDDQVNMNESASIWDETLNSSTQLSILPENQLTQPLLQSIASGGARPEQVMNEIQALTKKEKRKAEKKVAKKSAKKEAKKKKKEEDTENNFKNESGETFSSEPFKFDPNEVYTATPVTSASKSIASVSRSLNFGKDSDSENNSFRKIVPKPSSVKRNTLIFVDRNGQLLGQQDAQPGMIIPQMVVTPGNTAMGSKVVIKSNGELKFLNQAAGNQPAVTQASTGNQLSVTQLVMTQTSNGCQPVTQNSVGNQPAVPQSLAGNQISIPQISSGPSIVNVVPMNTTNVPATSTEVLDAPQSLSNSTATTVVGNCSGAGLSTVPKSTAATVTSPQLPETSKDDTSLKTGSGDCVDLTADDGDAETSNQVVDVQIIEEIEAIGSVESNKSCLKDDNETNKDSNCNLNKLASTSDLPHSQEGETTSVEKEKSENCDENKQVKIGAVVDAGFSMLKSVDTTAKDNGKALPKKTLSKIVKIPKIRANPVRDPRLARKNALYEQKVKCIMTNEKIKQKIAGIDVQEDTKSEIKNKHSETKTDHSPALVKTDVNNRAAGTEQVKENDEHSNRSRISKDSNKCQLSKLRPVIDTKESKAATSKTDNKLTIPKEEGNDIKVTSRNSRTAKTKTETPEKHKKKNTQSTKHEKLKVRITCKKGSSSDKGRTGLKQPFRKVTQPVVSDSSDEDDMPLCALKDKIRKDQTPKKTNESGSVNSQSENNNHSDVENDEEGKESTNVLPKPNISDDLDISVHELSSEEGDNPSLSAKEELLERVGLTPTKAVQSILQFKSPERANPLDVLAQWQHSKYGSKRRTPSSNCKTQYVSSPARSTTKRTPAKKLFETPEKSKVNQITKGEWLSPLPPSVFSPRRTPVSGRKLSHIGTPVKSPALSSRKTPAKNLFASPEKNMFPTVASVPQQNPKTENTVTDAADGLVESDGKAELSSDLLKALESEVLSAVDSITAEQKAENTETTEYLNDSCNSGVEVPTHNNDTHDSFNSHPALVNGDQIENIKHEACGVAVDHGVVQSGSLEKSKKKKDKKKKHKKDKKHKHRKRSHSGKLDGSNTGDMNGTVNVASKDSLKPDDKNDSFEENKPYNANTDCLPSVKPGSVTIIPQLHEVNETGKTIIPELPEENGTGKTITPQLPASFSPLTTPMIDSSHREKRERHSGHKSKKGKKRRREDDSLDRETRREKKRQRREEKKHRQSLERLASIDIEVALQKLAEHSSPQSTTAV